MPLWVTFFTICYSHIILTPALSSASISCSCCLILSVKCVGILSLYSGYLCFCCLPVIRIMEINEVFFFQFRKLHTVISKKSSKNKGSSLHVAHFKVNIITCAKRCADVPQQLKPLVNSTLVIGNLIGRLLLMQGWWLKNRCDYKILFTARCYASTVLAMGLCSSVTSRSSTKMAKHRITQTTPHDSPGTLVFWRQRSLQNLNGVTPYKGAECWSGGSKSATFYK